MLTSPAASAGRRPAPDLPPDLASDLAPHLRLAAAAVRVRAATPADVTDIHRIIDLCAAQGAVLPRHAEDIHACLPGFVVGELVDTAGPRVMGCAALVACGADMAEIRSVAVDPESRGTGLGRAVVEHLVAEARALGVEQLFLLTRIPDFFARIGFSPIDPELLPDHFVADLIHVQKRSIFNKHVMTMSLTDLGPAI
ncbi:MAG: GNAT family N-acetyltransferase [Phycisphaerales bacterium]|nr:GNAT family N-acetyltransferase [Phycisphaerales bacterium]